MRIGRIAAGCALAFVAAAAFAQDPVRHATLDEGCRAALATGRPVLVVTAWKQGVCNACDTWRERVPSDAKFAAVAKRFERVDWLYDGLEGKVIPWTLANGGTSRDPTVQVFVANPAGRVLGRCPTEKAFTPSQVTDWLEEAADAWDRDHPQVALPLRRAAVEVTAKDTSAAAACAAVDDARAAGRPVLLYFGRDYEPPVAPSGVSAVAAQKEPSRDDKARRAEVAAAREFEKKVLDSKSAADASEGWTLLRFDLWDEAHARYAASLGVDKAPALLLIVAGPGEERPIVLPKTLTGADLAFRLKKSAPPR